MSPTPLRVALDWTPNTLHAGLYLAQARGFYEAEGLAVTLLPPGPADSDAPLTPAKRLRAGLAELAVCPSDSCIAYAADGDGDRDQDEEQESRHRRDGRERPRRLRLQAIYALLQREAHAIVGLSPSSSSTETTANTSANHNDDDGLALAELLRDGIYGSYGARFEDATVRAMLAHITGDERRAAAMRTENCADSKLSLFDRVLHRRDLAATWVFLPWEGVEAELAGGGSKLVACAPRAYGVPYGYSPVIARDVDREDVGFEALKGFVRATRRGYEVARREPGEAVRVLAPVCTPARSDEFLTRSQERVAEAYSDGVSSLGWMRREVWEEWVSWLRERGLVQRELDLGDLFTNEFFGGE